MKKPKSYPLVRVTWVDAHAGGEWIEDDKEILASGYVVKTVGYKVFANKEVVTIASTSDGNGMVNCTMTIPNGMIKKIEVLDRS
jgi:hypothetical protein